MRETEAQDRQISLPKITLLLGEESELDLGVCGLQTLHT